MSLYFDMWVEIARGLTYSTQANNLFAGIKHCCSGPAGWRGINGIFSSISDSINFTTYLTLIGHKLTNVYDIYMLMTYDKQQKR